MHPCLLLKFLFAAHHEVTSPLKLVMERGKAEKSRKRKHHHRSRSDSEDEESSNSSASSSGSESESEDYSSSSGSESESESLEEEERPSKSRKKARRSSESEKRKSRKGRREKERRKSKGSSRKKERKKKKLKAKKRETISMDDYYLKSAEFRTWLSKERGVFFSELTSEESRKLFKKFVNKWNGGLLKKKYYQGIQSSAVGHDTQSKYQWKFAAGVDSGELKSMRESVSSWTASTPEDQEGVGGATGALIGPRRPGSSAQSRPGIGPSIGPPFKGPSSRSMDPFEREERREEERGRLKKERRDFRKHQEAVLEELVPKAGPGREARLEKKKMMAQKRREREISPEMAESTLMGPAANIKEKIRNRQEERQNRAQAAAQKISDYQAKEKAKMAAILEMAKANKKEGAMW